MRRYSQAVKADLHRRLGAPYRQSVAETSEVARERQTPGGLPMPP